MIGIKFVTVSELDRKASSIVAEVDKGKTQIVITRGGRPVSLLQKVRDTETGRKETVFILKNESARIVTELIKNGKQIIITKDTEPVALLQKITDTAFSVENENEKEATSVKVSRRV